VFLGGVRFLPPLERWVFCAGTTITSAFLSEGMARAMDVSPPQAGEDCRKYPQVPAAIFSQ
jgi:hypothetical protein